MSATKRLIGDQGTTFGNSFVNFSQCCPSRATQLSGQYAQNHGVLGVYPPTGGYGKFDSRNSLALWLQRGGYRTGHIGKMLNGYGSDSPANIPAGWTEWYASVDPSTYRMYGHTLNENGVFRTYGDPEEEAPAVSAALGGAVHRGAGRGDLAQLSAPPGVAAGGRRGDRAGRRCAAREWPAGEHLHRLHLRQRLPAGPASHPEREDRALRALDPRAAGRPRAGRAARPYVERDGRQRRPRPDDRRRDGRQAVEGAGWPVAVLRPLQTFKGIRKDRYLYVAYRSNTKEMYDLARDPFQLDSVIDDPRYRAARRELRSQITALKRCRGRTCRLQRPEVPGPGPKVDSFLGIDPVTISTRRTRPGQRAGAR